MGEWSQEIMSGTQSDFGSRLCPPDVRDGGSQFTIFLSSLGGLTHKVVVDSKDTVGSLKRKAEVVVGRRVKKLVCADGSILQPYAALVRDLHIADKSSVTAILTTRVEIYTTSRAFAAIKAGGANARDVV